MHIEWSRHHKSGLKEGGHSYARHSHDHEARLGRVGLRVVLDQIVERLVDHRLPNKVLLGQDGHRWFYVSAYVWTRTGTDTYGYEVELLVGISASWLSDRMRIGLGSGGVWRG